MTETLKNIFSYFSHRWWLLLAALVTGSFTWHAAGYFWGSLFYQAMAVIFTEGALLVWVYRLEGAIGGGDDGVRDANEDWQMWFSIVAAVISFAAIIATDLASAAILANEAGVFDVYASIPGWAQFIVTNLVWILASANVLLGGLYQAMSPEAVLERVKAASERKVQRAKVKAERERAIHEAQAYEREAMPLARDTGNAEGVRRAREKFAPVVPPDELAPRQYQADAANFQKPVSPK